MKTKMKYPTIRDERATNHKIYGIIEKSCLDNLDAIDEMEGRLASARTEEQRVELTRGIDSFLKAVEVKYKVLEGLAQDFTDSPHFYAPQKMVVEDVDDQGRVQRVRFLSNGKVGQKISHVSSYLTTIKNLSRVPGAENSGDYVYAGAEELR